MTEWRSGRVKLIFRSEMRRPKECLDVEQKDPKAGDPRGRTAIVSLYTHGFCAAAAGRSVCPVHGESVSDRRSRLENASQLDLLSHMTPDTGVHFNLQGKDDVNT